MRCRPLFRKFSQELDTTADFVIYKADSSRLCEEEIIKLLQDLRRCVICFLIGCLCINILFNSVLITV